MHGAGEGKKQVSQLPCFIIIVYFIGHSCFKRLSRYSRLNIWYYNSGFVNVNQIGSKDFRWFLEKQGSSINEFKKSDQGEFVDPSRPLIDNI